MTTKLIDTFFRLKYSSLNVQTITTFNPHTRFDETSCKRVSKFSTRIFCVSPSLNGNFLWPSMNTRNLQIIFSFHIYIVIN